MQGQEAQRGHQRLWPHRYARSAAWPSHCARRCLRWCRAVSAAGRNFLRCVEGRDNSNLNIVVINDSGAPRPRALFPLGGAVPCRPAPCISTFGRLSCRPRRAGGVKQASHLLKYDSTLGTFNADVQCAPTRWPRRVERARRCV